MTLVMEHPRVKNERRLTPALVAEMGLDEDASPFGLQGLKREIIRILKPECINALAMTLALRATPQQIHDPEFVQSMLDLRHDWQDEYRVVHLIEKSLWINGRSDLVMTLLRNPSQIPDSPPREIHNALLRANTVHPDATIWYGVPLFSDRNNEDGLPIPLTAAEVREEAVRRVAAAQQQASNRGWMYRAAQTAGSIPSRIGNTAQAMKQRLHHLGQRWSEYYQRARRDSRRRAHAVLQAQMEHCRFGCSFTSIPEHSTWLGRYVTFAVEMGYLFEAMLGDSHALPSVPQMSPVPATLAEMIPLFFIPMSIIAADPFLFVELPEEPGKLRHLGHWYWQSQANGKQKLHLHA